ncbi:four helix bundle protein [Nitrogeniibacter mangrovi]|uniref:Four helix bundle protein n=1 Tax=Nitrogeniibacter mangrovi TaxID=2016596 RepID=A0A6C1B4Y9_9RHOO|nr:four helix bundle protein [Nitrogeniibacter mangrovi]QID18752.1 four helix bundle protein [Nitrogeniibacter mangrovi]
MPNERPHRRLLAWQESMKLATHVYALTNLLPAEERFALSSQMRRAAISIPSNIAEGAARGSKKEFVHFLGLSRGSLSELDTQITLAKDLGFVMDTAAVEAQVNRIFRLINGLISSTRATLETNHQ